MSNVYIFLDSDGNPKHGVEAFTEGFYENGKVYNGDTCILYKGNVSQEDLLNFHYYEDGEFKPRPACPGRYFRWDKTLREWLNSKTVEDSRVEKLAAIKLKLKIELNAPLDTEFGTFDCAAKDRANIAEAVAYLQNSNGAQTTVTFTLKDNSTVVLSLGDLLSVSLLAGERTQKLMNNSQRCRALIDAATTIAEVEAVVW